MFITQLYNDQDTIWSSGQHNFASLSQIYKLWGVCLSENRKSLTSERSKMNEHSPKLLIQYAMQVNILSQRVSSAYSRCSARSAPRKAVDLKAIFLLYNLVILEWACWYLNEISFHEVFESITITLIQMRPNMGF